MAIRKYGKMNNLAPDRHRDQPPPRRVLEAREVIHTPPSRAGQWGLSVSVVRRDHARLIAEETIKRLSAEPRVTLHVVPENVRMDVASFDVWTAPDSFESRYVFWQLVQKALNESVPA